jgi:hypothetical protein
VGAEGVLEVELKVVVLVVAWAAVLELIAACVLAPAPLVELLVVGGGPALLAAVLVPTPVVVWTYPPSTPSELAPTNPTLLLERPPWYGPLTGASPLLQPTSTTHASRNEPRSMSYLTMRRARPTLANTRATSSVNTRWPGG